MSLIKQTLSIFGRGNKDTLPEVETAADNLNLPPSFPTEEELYRQLQDGQWELEQRIFELHEYFANEVFGRTYQTAVAAGYADENGNWPTKETRERHEPN